MVATTATGTPSFVAGVNRHWRTQATEERARSGCGAGSPAPGRCGRRLDHELEQGVAVRLRCQRGPRVMGRNPPRRLRRLDARIVGARQSDADRRRLCRHDGDPHAAQLEPPGPALKPMEPNSASARSAVATVTPSRVTLRRSDSARTSPVTHVAGLLIGPDALEALLVEDLAHSGQASALLAAVQRRFVAANSAIAVDARAEQQGAARRSASAGGTRSAARSRRRRAASRWCHRGGAACRDCSRSSSDPRPSRGSARSRHPPARTRSPELPGRR